MPMAVHAKGITLRSFCLLKKRVAAISLLIVAFLQAATIQASAPEMEPPFSSQLKMKVMRYHSNHPDFRLFAHVRPQNSREWVFEKADFTQYLFSLRQMVLKIHEIIDGHISSGTLTDEEHELLLSLIQNRDLEAALWDDLSAEHPAYRHATLSREAGLYLDHLEALRANKDPLPLLISVYTVVLGHAFGAQAFLTRAEALGLGFSPASRAYPKDRADMQDKLMSLIDRVDLQEAEHEDSHATEKRHDRYLAHLLLEFVIQGSSLRVLDKSMPPLDLKLYRFRRELLLKNPGALMNGKALPQLPSAL